jgi:hypothetical protein
LLYQEITYNCKFKNERGVGVKMPRARVISRTITVTRCEVVVANMKDYTTRTLFIEIAGKFTNEKTLKKRIERQMSQANASNVELKYLALKSYLEIKRRYEMPEQEFIEKATIKE